MLWFCCWMIALSKYDGSAGDTTDPMRPPGWTGNYWGPAAARARAAGQLPPLPANPEMVRRKQWGRGLLRDGDIVFRLGNAATFPRLVSPEPVHRQGEREPLLAHGGRRDSRRGRSSSTTVRLPASSASLSSSGCSTVSGRWG